MKKKFKYGLLIVTFLLTTVISKGYTKESGKENGTWYCYVPPRGVESNFPPYSEWVPVMFENDNNKLVKYDVKANDKDNPDDYLYLLMFGYTPDGQNLTQFQLNHIVYINDVTGEVIKSIHWK